MPLVRARLPHSIRRQRIPPDADVHYGLAAAKATERAAVLATARARNPERFNTTQDPKILTIPDAAWINQPADQTQTEPTEAEQAA